MKYEIWENQKLLTVVIPANAGIQHKYFERSELGNLLRSIIYNLSSTLGAKS